MSPAEIRKSFLEFFAQRGHRIVPSAPLVIKGDPTLLFTNAGMNQFKDLFLGIRKADNARVADTQKCLRVSGKHNDLEEVGIDTYHHTMFEMLGNWSFGTGGEGYFKKESIEWAWELLTSVYQLPKDRLYVTVFEGSTAEKLDFDEEAAAEWAKYISTDRILKGNKKDNFWEMGDTGPCGPCSEIHIDLRSDAERANTPGHALVNNDHPQVIEIWNLVFMEFNRKADGSLEYLPGKYVDTGMGFERLVRAIDGKSSNYDTEIFRPYIRKMEELAGVVYGKSEKIDIACRVIADHIRAVAFSITDGQLPSNTGAGYVIRRILRRAVRYGYSSLNIREPFMHKLVEVWKNQFTEVFDGVAAQSDLAARVIREEEQSFLKTLGRGIDMLHDWFAAGNKEVPGNKAFELFDTYGFPLDLTQLIARENGAAVDVDGFNAELEEQRQRSRAAAAQKAGDWVMVHQSSAEPIFTGYDTLVEENVRIMSYRLVEEKNKRYYQLVLDKSPFYPEGGGQIGDTGMLEAAGVKIEIFNTLKENNQAVHFAKAIPYEVSGYFTARVNADKRLKTQRNHSATHLLHAALREILGKHVEQKGSYVGPDNLRFDFSHFAKVSDDQILTIEQRVNEKIMENIVLDERRKVPMAEAVKAGAMALFGEKYGEEVRVITFDPSFSVELCGGTHISATGGIGFFKIIAESAVAAGIRRIEALTGTSAEEFMQQQLAILNEVKSLTGNQPAKAIQSLQDEVKALRKRIETMETAQIAMLKLELLEKAKEINGRKIVIAQVPLESAEALKNLSFQLKNSSEKLIAVLGCVISGKPLLSVILTDNLVLEGLNAGQVIKTLAKHIQGGGGGQPFYATAGGSKAEGLKDAMAEAEKMLKDNEEAA